MIETSVQIKFYITETQKALHHMVRIVGLKRQVLVDMSYISDFGYSWCAIWHYIPLMHHRIAVEPKIVLMLKTVFLKLASIMNQPMLRIIEANSSDVSSVSKFYSNQLV